MLSEAVTIAGVDEVGRGPLAGPVVAAAVILDTNCPIAGLTDSKKLSAQKREILAEQIKAKAIAWAIARAEVAEIDHVNILQASLLAMQRAIGSLSIKPQQVWVDGQHVPAIDFHTVAVIRGDELIPCISAASIIAKVERDALMVAYDTIYPEFGFAHHKGYGTQQHLLAIQQFGITPIHRKSFKPIRLKKFEQV